MAGTRWMAQRGGATLGELLAVVNVTCVDVAPADRARKTHLNLTGEPMGKYDLERTRETIRQELLGLRCSVAPLG